MAESSTEQLLPVVAFRIVKQVGEKNALKREGAPLTSHHALSPSPCRENVVLVKKNIGKTCCTFRKKMKMKLCHMAARSGKIMTFLPYKWTRAFFTLYTLMLFAPLSSDGELIIILEDLKIRHVIAVPSKT